MNVSLLHVIIIAVPLLVAAAGLVYAAMQFRGWLASQYVANFTKLVELQLQLRKMVVDDPTLAPAGTTKVARTPAEEMRSYYYALMQMSVFEIAWFAHKQGQLTDDYFASWEAYIAAMAKYPAFRAMWQTDRTTILHDGFREYVDTLTSIESASVPEHVRPVDTPSRVVKASSDDSKRK
jgi:hypothetical protein